MARYFFDVRDGEYIPDQVGTELPDLAAARVHAVVYSGELLMRNAEQFWRGEEWQLEVKDQQGLILFSLMFLATNAPAVLMMPA